MAFSQTSLFFHLFDFATILLYYYIRLKSNKPVCKRKFLNFTLCPNFKAPSVAPASTARCRVNPTCKNSAHNTVLSLDIVAYEHSSLARHVRSKESWLFSNAMFLVAGSILVLEGNCKTTSYTKFEL